MHSLNNIQNMLRKIPTSVRIVSIILLIPLLTCLGFYLFITISYEIFMQAVLAAEPRYVQLNMNVLNSIPVPKEAKEVDRQLTDKLTVTYAIKNNAMTEISSFYDHFLISHGWRKVLTSVEINIYKRGTSCFMIEDDNTDTYSVSIQHDYFKQSFSPQHPPDWVMFFYKPDEYGIDGWEGYFPRCPDQ